MPSAVIVIIAFISLTLHFTLSENWANIKSHTNIYFYYLCMHKRWLFGFLTRFYVWRKRRRAQQVQTLFNERISLFGIVVMVAVVCLGLAKLRVEQRYFSTPKQNTRKDSACMSITSNCTWCSNAIVCIVWHFFL